MWPTTAMARRAGGCSSCVPDLLQRCDGDGGSVGAPTAREATTRERKVWGKTVFFYSVGLAPMHGSWFYVLVV